MMKIHILSKKDALSEIKADDSMFFKDSKTNGLVNDQYRDKLFSEKVQQEVWGM